MEVIDKRERKTIPYKPSVFHIHSKEQEGDTEHVSFEDLRIKGKKLVVIKSPLLSKDNYNVVHTGSRLNLIISEKKQIEKPLYVHNLGVKHHDFSEYERLKSFMHYLPDDFYVHVETKWNEPNNSVEVYFK